MRRWLEAGLCGLVAMGFVAGCSGGEPETGSPTMIDTRASLTFDMLVNALPPAAEGPLGLPYKAGCPDAGNVDCDEVDAIENNSVSRVWGPSERPKREAWIRPYVLLQVSEFPDEASAAHMAEDGRASYAPEFDGVFDIPAEQLADRERLGNRGEGILEDASIAEWTGYSGRAEHTLSNIFGEESALYSSEILTVQDGRFLISCRSTQLAPNENGEVCVDAVTEMVRKVEEGR